MTRQYDAMQFAPLDKTRTGIRMSGVYIMEVGNVIKVGCSRHIVARVSSLERQFKAGGANVGKVFASQNTASHYYAERAVHDALSLYRINNELFEMSIEQAIEILEKAKATIYVTPEDPIEIPAWADAFIGMTELDKSKIAGYIGVSIRTIYNWASGKTVPKRATADAIRRAFRRMGGRA